MCSLSTGRMRHPAAPRRGRDQLAGHHQHFLVGERDRLAGVDRRQHRLERGGARRRAQDDVDVGVRGDGDQPLGPARDDTGVGRRRRESDPRPRPRPARRPAGRYCAGLLRPAVRRCRRRRAPPRAGAPGCASTTASALRPIEPVDPRIASVFTAGPADTGRTSASRTAARRCGPARRRGPGISVELSFNAGVALEAATRTDRRRCRRPPWPRRAAPAARAARRPARAGPRAPGTAPRRQGRRARPRSSSSG